MVCIQDLVPVGRLVDGLRLVTAKVGLTIMSDTSREMALCVFTSNFLYLGAVCVESDCCFGFTILFI